MQNNRVAAVFPLLLACFAATSALGAQHSDPALQVRNPRLEVQRATPDARLPPFDKVMLAPIELHFRPTAPLTGLTGYSGTRTEFPVGEQEQQEIAAAFDRILREELAKSGNFTLVDAAGDGVLLLRPALRDIVSRVPPEEPPGRSAVYVDVVGEATLVVDFIDGATDRTLATAVDRRKAEPAGSGGDFGAVRATRVGAGREVRLLARRWGMSLKRRVEQLYYEAKPK